MSPSPKAPNKKVLIITYYWPPAGGSGVQRWLKFIKYLPKFGWVPIVYVPQNPTYPVIDHSFDTEIPDQLTVLKKKILEPYSIYEAFLGRKKKGKTFEAFTSAKKGNSFKEKVSNYIRSNLFMPDPRIAWVKPSVRFLSGYIKKHNIDVVITTGPPHSLHLIGMKLKKRLGIKWLADFRDPWTDIYYYKELKLTKWADKKQHELERRVLRSADQCMVVGNTMKKGLLKKGASHVNVITNGFDAEEYNNVEVSVDDKFSISHIGLLSKFSNPENLWKALQLLSADFEFSQRLELKMIGNLDYEVKLKIEENRLLDNLTVVERVPHNEVISLQCSAQVLLLILPTTGNPKEILTGKFFEYLASNRPILALGPTDGDVADIIKETQSGIVCEYNDLEGIKNAISGFYELYLKGNLSSKPKNIELYTREKNTEQLSELLNKMVVV